MIEAKVWRKRGEEFIKEDRGIRAWTAQSPYQHVKINAEAVQIKGT